MDVASVYLDLFGRVPPLAREVVDGLDVDQLTKSPAPGANTISWLVWHLTRVADHHVSELLELDQVWVEGEWAAGFGLEPDPHNTGYNHSAEEVASVRPERPELLTEYLDAVDARTRGLLRDLTEENLDRIVDEGWDPPVTLGVRLVSIADDAIQHIGQAGYVRGLLGY